jgi:voltage-gated potassium channel
MIDSAWNQIKTGLFIFLAIIIVGTIGYSILIEDWNAIDALYMTIITITTTGFREVHPLTIPGKIFTIFLIIAGVGTIAYTGGRTVQLLVETQLFRRRRMSRKLEELKDHYIVCGYGRVGRGICDELHVAKTPFVVIEREPEKIEKIIALGFLFVNGDATSDEVLISAGLKRAKGLVATLATDAENVFTTLSAKNINPKIFIVARAMAEETESKLIKAGANRVVKTAELGAQRMTNLLLRPGVVDFIDLVAFKKGPDLSIEEVSVRADSQLVGHTLGESPIRQNLNIIIVAIVRGDKEYIYNPNSATLIIQGDRLIAIGKSENLVKLDELCLAGS